MNSANFSNSLLPYENCIVAFRFQMKDPQLEEDRAERCENIFGDSPNLSFGHVERDMISVFNWAYSVSNEVYSDDASNMVIDSKSELKNFKIIRIASSDEIYGLKEAIFNGKMRIIGRDQDYLHINKEGLENLANVFTKLAFDISYSEIEDDFYAKLEDRWYEIKTESENTNMKLSIIFSTIVNHRNQKSTISNIPKEVRNYILSFILKLK